MATALVGPDGILGYAELEARVAALAARLRAGGIRSCALLADNGPDWIIADLAMMMAGVTAVPVPLFFSENQLLHLLSDAAVDAVLTEDPEPMLGAGLGFEPPAAAVGRRLSLLRRSSRAGAAIRQSAEIAKLTYTSGSTGAPRGVCLTQAGMEDVAVSLAERLRATGVTRHLCVMPLATLLENIAGVYVPLLLGAAIHAVPLADVGLSGSSGLDPDRLRRAIDRHGAESVILLPQLLNVLNRLAAERPWTDCPLRFVAVGGGRVAPAELELAHRHGIPAYEGYGLSECHSVVALNSPGASRVGSVGRPLEHTRVRIADDGEIVVSGAVMHGYLGEAGGSRSEIGTGDLGSLDEDGFLYVQGRKKNLFITAFGRNVSPEWVESELLHEPAIAQALVWGEAMPRNAALIVPAGPVGDDRVQAAVDAANRRLPDYARIGEWMYADAPFGAAGGELTDNGRLRRQVILDRYGERLTDLINGAEAPRNKVINA